ncbi:MAG TPA: creatininase family protein [Ignavibacteriales bacterium]|nr:creatininase family protein [Ignavibacteriales bacterium]
MKKFLSIITVLFLVSSASFAQETPGLSTKYEELTSPDFKTAVEKSEKTCIIPMGILEKHGPHLPLGTDMLDVREIVSRAAQKEYTIIFPQYYFGQIFEARHQPGTIAYSHDLVWNMLQETCDELSRNGIKKIILVNGHGGNTYFLRYFCQAQLEKRKDYAVILFTPSENPEVTEKVKKLRKTTNDGHAGETETSEMLVTNAPLVHLDQAKSQNGEDQKRLKDLPDSFSGIWWYARFPNHYAGDGSAATKEIGELLVNNEVAQLTKFIQNVKKNNNILDLQKQFFDESENPLKTELH